MTDPDAATEPRWMLPRGLIVLLGMTGLLVTILALQQFAAILAPVLLALVLVIGFHPLIGILRRRGAPTWLAVTTTVLTLVVVILGLAAALALSVAQLATILPTYQTQFTQPPPTCAPGSAPSASAPTNSKPPSAKSTSATSPGCSPACSPASPGSSPTCCSCCSSSPSWPSTPSDSPAD